MHLQITKTGYLAHWHFSLKVGQVFCACLAILLSISAKSQTTLVDWNFEDKNPIADLGLQVNLNREISTNSTGVVGYPTGNGGIGWSTSNTQWTNGQNQKYWKISFTSQGYKRLNISSKQQSSNSGPHEFKVQCSVDELNWEDVGAQILVQNNFTSGVLSDYALPASCDDQPIVFVRWIMSSNTAVNGSAVISAGTSRIDDIVIKGFLIPVLTSPLTHSCCSGSVINYIPAGSGNVFDWSRTAIAGILEEASNGSGTINEFLSNTTPLPIMVDYTFDLELNGCTNRQTVVVTVNPKPDLTVSPISQILCPNLPTQPIIFSNPNQLPGTSISWEWTRLNSEKISVIPSSGTISPIIATINTSEPDTILETSIKITATSSQGCSSDQVIIMSVGDSLPPTFTEWKDTLTFCVDDIINATANGVDDISELRPDYFTLIPSYGTLDLNPSIFFDNCTEKEALVLHWRIDFHQNPNSIAGTGQPSLRDTAIVLPGSADYIVNHKITYWLEDASRNVTPNDRRAVVVISVHPRPQIDQDF